MNPWTPWAPWARLGLAGRTQAHRPDLGWDLALSQAAAAVAPTNEHALKNRQQAFKGLESLGLSAAEIAKIEGGGSESPSRGASKEQVGDDDGDDAPPAPRPGPMLKRS